MRNPCLLLLLTLACGCAGKTGRDVRPPEAPRGAAPAADRSLTSKRYVKLGVPSIDRPWSARELASAAKALTAMAEKTPESLPRRLSQRSGAVFSRITASPKLESTLDGLDGWLTSINEIQKAYIKAAAYGHDYETEMIELAGVELRLMAALLRNANGFRATLDREDPTYVVRIAGLHKMKQAFAGGVGGALLVLGARKADRPEHTARLLEHMREAVPAIVAELDSRDRTMILGRISELRLGPSPAELEPSLAKLYEAVRGVGDAADNYASLSPEDFAIQQRGLRLYEQRSDSEAYQAWHGLAQKGHAESQYNIGVMTASGQGVPASPADAFKWFEKAAEGGYPEAYHELGKFHLSGIVVEKDESMAVALFEQAAEHDVLEALYNVAIMKLHGQGVDVDVAAGLASMERAGELGSVSAQATLGTWYLGGEHVAPDFARARGWLEWAARQGHADATYHLGLIYDQGMGVQASAEQARTLYAAAAEQQHPMALNNLGVMYLNGRSVEQDDRKAFEYFEKAFELGNLDGAVNLGDLYSLGRGVGADKAKAAEFYRLAAEGGNAIGQCRYAHALQDGEGVTSNVAEAAAWREKARVAQMECAP